MRDLHVDENRYTTGDGLTGIYVRAIAGGAWGNADIAQLTRPIRLCRRVAALAVQKNTEAVDG
jgi:hypothetical protein